MIIRFIIFGLLGLVAALAVGAVKRSVAARKLTLSAETSLALFPIFGLTAFFYPLIAMRVSSLPWYGRGLAYMVAFFVLQYAIGFGLQKIGRCPWGTSGKGSIGGLVDLADAPIWFLLGLAVEWSYPLIKAASVALG